MRAAPAFQLTVARFGVWHVLLVAVLGTALAAASAWLWQRRTSFAALESALAVMMLVVLPVAATRLRQPAFSLRWDGRQWHVGEPGSSPDEAWAGTLRVAIDLGGWLLLHFTPASGPRRCAYRWLPVQREACPAQWHALRGAVYSARSNRPLSP